jgi:ABC-type lipoprotein export system ATPase subunit
VKILKLYLKNFSRVKSAFGVDEITIDLTSSENMFLFLQGENGSGKSTLLNQMQP